MTTQELIAVEDELTAVANRLIHLSVAVVPPKGKTKMRLATDSLGKAAGWTRIARSLIQSVRLSQEANG